MTSNEHSPNHDCLMSILAKYIPNVNIQQQFRVFFPQILFYWKTWRNKNQYKKWPNAKKNTERKRERERI